LKERGAAGVYRTGDESFIQDILALKRSYTNNIEGLAEKIQKDDHLSIGKMITLLEGFNELKKSSIQNKINKEISELKTVRAAKIVGVTGPGGAGKSTFIDEIVRRFNQKFNDKKAAIISVDPTRKTGGALLGDRIRMNYIDHPHIFMRSLASKGSLDGLSKAVEDSVDIFNAAGYDLIIVETVGMAQMNIRISEISDLTINIMTREFGSALQLEKIDMIDEAHYNVMNKMDRPGSRSAFDELVDRAHVNQMEYGRKQKVFGIHASDYIDRGVDILFENLVSDLNFTDKVKYKSYCSDVKPIIPHKSSRYLGDAVEKVKEYNEFANNQVEIARDLFALERTKEIDSTANIDGLIEKTKNALHPDCRKMLEDWDLLVKCYEESEHNDFKSQIGIKMRRIELPKSSCLGERLKFLLYENVPGRFPFVNGVYAFKMGKGQAPTRMFAGLRTPEETNRRFHFLSKGHPVARLSTAFDGITLFGEDPDVSEGDYGKIGESGVSICTLDDMKKLYDGFELGDGKMSVSMTINGPAPAITAMFLNTAIDQQIDKFKKETGKAPSETKIVEIRKEVFSKIRGTAQADILKEDIAQNSCIFSLEFALRLMGDMQEYFINNSVKKFYSVSISGYHIAEAGANPIQQLAYTLSNGLTYVEYYLSRGMDINELSKNLSYFFSTGLDEEYTVIGRVARKIWAVVIRDLYSGNEKSQKMRYHIQTSGRSLQEREADFNDIRTSLQALTAWIDAANSLHTNSYDEAYTTPT
ncbi:methylmalonyl-CoA mutase family protein, partial [candidate division KSB1 bacterium]